MRARSLPDPSALSVQRLKDFRRRCEDSDANGIAARIDHVPKTEMTRGVASTITGAATVDLTTPPAEILDADEPVLGDRVIASCDISARLRVPPEFDLDDREWIQRSFLTHDTVRWTWYVTPRTVGRHEIVMEVKPVVSLRSGSVTTVADPKARRDVETYSTVVDVKVSAVERSDDIMSRLARTLNVARGLVQAMTALIGALVLLAATVGGLRRRRKKTS
jgi:hypothetical protein